ncbi:Calcium-dependent phosphoinositide phospholipase C [Balamuthia mandrillaris]
MKKLQRPSLCFLVVVCWAVWLGAPAATAAFPDFDICDGSLVSNEELRLNQIQVLASHNSYRQLPHLDWFAVVQSVEPEQAAFIEYSHFHLSVQAESLRVRGFELDVFYDPDHRYATPSGFEVIKTSCDECEYDPEGFMSSTTATKVLHIQDIDYMSNCLTLPLCLQELMEWSDSVQQEHLPLFIQLEAKDTPVPFNLPIPTTQPLPWNSTALETLHDDILSVIPKDRIISPSSLMSEASASTLKAALQENGWPTLAASKGKFLFFLDNRVNTAINREYREAEFEKLIFFETEGASDDFASVFVRNEPLEQFEEIESLVANGFIVRTRADADLIEGRNGDTNNRQAAAWASGAQIVSTDFERPLPSVSADYVVFVPNRCEVRCNPISAAEVMGEEAASHQCQPIDYASVEDKAAEEEEDSDDDESFEDGLSEGDGDGDEVTEGSTLSTFSKAFWM